MCLFICLITYLLINQSLIYIEEISIKRDAKKIKYYQISKNYCKLLANSLAMIAQFL